MEGGGSLRGSERTDRSRWSAKEPPVLLLDTEPVFFPMATREEEEEDGIWWVKVGEGLPFGRTSKRFLL